MNRISRKSKMLDHIKRLQVICVSFPEYKGALEAYSAIGMLPYDEVLPMLDKYKDYALNNAKSNKLPFQEGEN